MAMYYIWLNANPDFEPYLRRAREERAAVVYAGWKAVTGAVGGAFRGLVERIRRARRARRTAEALSGLSDRQLQDIGLTRGEIGSVSLAAAAEPAEARATLSELRRAEAARGDSRRGRPDPWTARVGDTRTAAGRRKAA